MRFALREFRRAFRKFKEKKQRKSRAILIFNFRTIYTEETENPAYLANPTNRCYHCKTELYGKLSAIAKNENIEYILDGTNADDAGDYRPGKMYSIFFVFLRLRKVFP